MKRSGLIAAVLLSLLPLTAAAQDQWTFSLLAADISNADSTFAGRTYQDGIHSGIGLALAYHLTPAWSLEAAVSRQSYTSPFTDFQPVFGVPGVAPVTSFNKYDVIPLDLVGTRTFRISSRVSPYVRAGIRYVDGPDDEFTDPYELVPLPPSIPPFVLVTGGYNLEDRFSAQVGGGLLFQVTNAVAIRGEITRLLRNDTATFDPLTRGSVGIAWKF